MTDLALYYSPGACSLAPHAALRQCGTEFDLRRVDVAAGEQHDPTYSAINPHQCVPTLVADGTSISEVIALALYFDQRFPQANLLPRDTLERAKALEWISYLATTAHPLFRSYWRTGWFAQDTAVHDELRRTAVARLKVIFAEIERAVSHQATLNAAELGFADLYTAVYLRWSQGLPGAVLGPAALAYRERLAGHAPLSAALAAEGVSLDSMQRNASEDALAKVGCAANPVAILTPAGVQVTDPQPGQDNTGAGPRRGSVLARASSG
jgi:glutathione S-transferase